MKPFNLEEAKAGAPVCTREGHAARIICYDRKHTIYPIIALIRCPNSSEEDLASYRINGKRLGAADHPYDLFMVEEEHYDISNFKPFDRVLVRDYDNEQWRASFFSHYEIDKGLPFSFPFATGGHYYFQCIPYNEETAHLIGTNDMPPKKYINW